MSVFMCVAHSPANMLYTSLDKLYKRNLGAESDSHFRPLLLPRMRDLLASRQSVVVCFQY